MEPAFKLNDKVKVVDNADVFNYCDGTIHNKIGTIVAIQPIHDEFYDEEDDIYTDGDIIDYEYNIQFDFNFYIQYEGETNNVWVLECDIYLINSPKKVTGFAKFIQKIEG